MVNKIPTVDSTTNLFPTAVMGALGGVFNKSGRSPAISALTATPGQNANAAAVMQAAYLAIANSSNAACDIGILGDSVVEGYGNTTTPNAWRSVFTADLRRRNGHVRGGRGFIGAFQTNSISPTPPSWPCALSGNTSFGSDFYGIKRYVTAMNTTGVATFTLQGTSVDIIYPVDPSFGSISYAVDGGTAVTISQSGTSADGVRTRVSLGASGPHTLVVKGVTDGSYLEGVIEYDGDESTGIRVHDGGHGGWRSDQWATGGIDGVKYWPAAIASMNYKLLIVALGVNDAAQGVAASTYLTNMTSLLGSIRAIYSGPIILMDYAAVQNQDALWPQYIAAMYQLAAADGNAIVADLSLRMPPYSQTLNHAAWFDSNHPTDMGHALIGKLMAAFVTPS